MGGSSKAQTVGYRYLLGLHAVFIHGEADNIGRVFFDDDRIAWRGVQQGGTITVHAPNLFGGDEREGGVSGQIDILLGEATQTVNAYLASQLGPYSPAYRGVTSFVFRGGTGYGNSFWFGNNPYLKKFGARMQRIFKTTDGAAQWYSAKAAIPVPGSTNTTEGVFDIPVARPQLTGDATGDFVGPMTGTVQEIAQAAVISRNQAYIAEFGPSAQQVYMDSAYYNGTSVIVIGNDTGNNYPPGTGVASVQTDMLCPSGYVASSPDGQTVVCTINEGTFDMNPAHIIRECLTDADWGMGYNAVDVDDVSFTAAADTLYNEGMGISLIWDRQNTIEEFIKEIVKHIDAALYVDRKTGKFTLKLIRRDYEVSELLTLDESNVDKVADYKRAAFGELVNSVSVGYWDAVTGTDASLTITDGALVQMQGAVINTTMQYPGFTNHAIASKVCQRDLTTLSTPLISCTVFANQDAKDLTLGGVFNFNWPDYEIENVVMRITGIAYGDGRNNQIRLTCTQDIFDTPALAFVNPTPPDWQDPNTEPEPATQRLAVEMPYLELVQREGQGSVDSALATNAELGIVGIAAGRPNSGAINAVVHTDSGSGFVEATVLDFCPTCLLAANVGLMDAVLPVSDTLDFDLIQVGSWVQFGSEIMAVVAIAADHTWVQVKRGCLDTVPVTHVAGEVGFFWDNYSAIDQTEYVTSDVVDVKILPRTGLGETDLEDAPIDSVTLNGRAWRPYAPGNFKINGDYFPNWITTGDTVLTWNHRDRKQQTGGSLIGFLDGNVGPEAGATYTVRVYDESNELIWEETGITGTSFTFTTDMETGGVVTPPENSLRDLVLSWSPFAYYRMDDASGAFQDLSGNARHASAQGGTFVRSQPSLAYSTVNHCTYFQTDCYFQVTTFPLVLSSAHTMGCVLQISTGVDSTFVFHKGNFASSGNQGCTIQLNANGSVKMQYFNGGWRELTTAAGLIPYGPNPFTFVFRYNGGSGAGAAEVIINGVKTAFGALPIALPNSTQPFQVGVSNQGSLVLPTDNTYFDEIFVVQAALSDVAIADYDELVRPPVQAGDNGELTFELLTLRDGKESWQKYSWTAKRQGYGFNYGEPYGAQAGFGFFYGQTYGV